MMVFVVFSLWNFTFDFIGKLTSAGSILDICTICRYGADDGYNIVNFALMYIIGGYLRLHGFSLSRPKVAMFLLLTIAFICGLMYFESWLTDGFALGTALSYHSPFVILSATFTFLLFNSINFNSKAINCLSKAAFMCFLIQGMFFSRLNIPAYVDKPVFVMLLHLLVSIAIIYGASYLMTLLYNATEGRLFSKLDKYKLPYFN